MSRAVFLAVLLIFVTAPYRVIPMIFLGEKKFPPFVNSLFYYIPYAVLSALVIPDILTSTGNIKTAACGTAAAVIISLFTDNSFYAMALSVIVTYIAFCIF